MLIKIKSITYSGLTPAEVDVEINIASRGMPSFDIVGLPNKAVEESKERVRTAIDNSGIQFPPKKITVNLAPGDVPKEGSFYDLPIAFGILSSSQNIKIPNESLFFGELSLDGTLRHTKGALLMALFAKENNYKNIFIPKASANEASVLEDVKVYGVESLSSLVNHFVSDDDLGQKMKPFTYKEQNEEPENVEFDMSEVVGQKQAKRAV
ncbi:MAG: magnesium chelatase domain-containing protein, partial [Candidatus Paceibacterota bacterium]